MLGAKTGYCARPLHSAPPVKVSHSVVSNSLGPHGLSSWNSPGQNTGVDSLSLLQGIFPTQGSNPGLPHCRRILYQLSHKGSPCGLLLGGIIIFKASNLHIIYILFMLTMFRDTLPSIAKCFIPLLCLVYPLFFCSYG